MSDDREEHAEARRRQTYGSAEDNGVKPEELYQGIRCHFPPGSPWGPKQEPNDE